MSALPGERAAEGTPLYVHLPFCAAKCHYCDFFSVAALGHDLGGMVEAVLAEARVRAPHRPRTVFLGGGTPSLLPGELLRRLLDGLDELTGFRDSAVEVTAECNPESLDRAKAALLVELGVERLSIGFQSLRGPILELFGRVHDVADAFRAYDAARAAGPRSVNVDLIYAVPGQDLDEWETDLARVIGLGPDHVAAYNLAFEEQTLFQRWLEEGRLTRCPEELELEFFQRTRARLAAAGLDAYEVSNFARTGHLCQHNVNYWENGDYVGIGPSAVSSTLGERRGNVRSVGEYRRALDAGLPESAVNWRERLEPIARLGETWWLGLRTRAGVDPAAARARAGLTDREPDPALATAEGLVELGLLEPAPDGRLRLTERGERGGAQADEVSREFIGLRPAPLAAQGRPLGLG
jgi:oxygen-independent coproporphyrinogen-3 oxidase